ncbi:helix-turn-helix transcriptional regulator [Cytobacillus pseudoceanisediminis]|uniref:helix-turn-helix domain-containing protein n=1 Tax=Cytobacillus pseudoceanisediminis TaxID=3051614 RepID=UPI00218A7BB0|nr:helix-turn-helix transcriptional regulator [Cytobacillus pseudoceanisediminis]UQX52314.1 helix-turn-helix transcriptional regulator [Cytobacillus pseudoceanisediminis]
MLGARLKKLRAEKKLTQRQLADKINVTHVSISGYENGNRSPDTETLEKLADFFEVSVDYLLGRSSISKGSDLDETFDSLAEITRLVKEYGIEQIGFFDIEEWKKLTPEDVEDIRNHFEWVAHKAKQRNKEDK